MGISSSRPRVRELFSLVLMSLLALALPVRASTLEQKSDRWVPYQNTSLRFTLKVPETWTSKATDKAVAFSSPDEAETHGAIGLMRVEEKTTIEDQASAYLAKVGNLSAWTRTSSRLAGSRAIKLVGSRSADQKTIQYFVEAPAGIYRIECVGPSAQWTSFGHLFTTMLLSLQFLP